MRDDHNNEEFNLMVQLTMELEKESERALAILAASYLDHLLGRLLINSMSVPAKEVEELLLEGSNAPLGTFSSRIEMSYCLGLLSKDERGDLNLIRKIRNLFAHKLMEVTFETSQIADRCRELKLAKVDGQPSRPIDCYKKASVRLMVNILLKIRNLFNDPDH